MAGLVLFLGVSLGGGLLIGYATAPGEWYASLVKPGFNPPDWVFGPVWAVLYVMVGVTGWRIWQRDHRSAAMRLWWAQIVLNFLWSPTFFSAHLLGLALAVVVALLSCVVALIIVVRPIDRITAWLLVPYALWLGYAIALNAAIVALN